MSNYICFNKFISKFFRNLIIPKILIVILFIANSSLAIDSTKNNATDSNKVRMLDSSEILKTNTVESFSPNTFHFTDTIKSSKLNTIKITKSDSTIPKINLHLIKPHKNSIGDDLGSDFLIFFKDWGGYLTYPFRMKGTDWLIGGAAITGTEIITQLSLLYHD